MTRRIEFTVPDEIGEAYDRARGDVPMAAWIKRVLETPLGQPSATGVQASAPSPAPEPPDQPPHVKGGRMKTARELAMERQAKLNEAKS